MLFRMRLAPPAASCGCNGVGSEIRSSKKKGLEDPPNQVFSEKRIVPCKSCTGK
jgi:hypothetical protein